VPSDELKEAIAADPDLQGLAERLANLFADAQPSALAEGLLRDDPVIIAESLHLSVDDAQQLADELHRAATRLAQDFPELDVAASFFGRTER
jgi:hypothetical protein